MEKNQHICEGCESEFIIEVLDSTVVDDRVQFCPFCGEPDTLNNSDDDE